MSQLLDPSRCMHNKRPALDAQLTVVVEAPRLNTPLRTHRKAGVLACLHISDAAVQGDLSDSQSLTHTSLTHWFTATTAALDFRTCSHSMRIFQ